MRFVIGDVQDAWSGIFARAGEQYPRTTLVLFNGGVRTGCGAASSDTGPFYCPADRRVYLDLGFFRELRDRFGAPGDFAQAYVIAHEVGHHVQNVLGILTAGARPSATGPTRPTSCRCASSSRPTASRASGRTRRTSGGSSSRTATWRRGSGPPPRSATTASRSQAGQRVDRETFTHGSSEQRTRWFLKGFQDGEVPSCDTFSADEL